jgi:hypothetical protein
MALKILSMDPTGTPCVHPGLKPSAVAPLAEQLREEGHTEILVGKSPDEALPYEKWKVIADGITVTAG